MKRRSKFNLSHYRMLSHNMGYLYPVSCFEVLPGDSIRMNTAVFLRCAPLVSPVMHPVHIKIHHWFVPNRLIWDSPLSRADSWEEFITGGPNNDNDATPPYRNSGTAPIGSLGDYLGLPAPVSGQTSTVPVSTLPFRAYSLIYNENYRDQDLEPLVEFPLTGGLDSFSYSLQRASWGDDYFTTARPWPQKGPSIDVPVNGAGQTRFAPVVPQSYDGTDDTSLLWNPQATPYYNSTNHPASLQAYFGNVTGAGPATIPLAVGVDGPGAGDTIAAKQPLYFDLGAPDGFNGSGLKVDLGEPGIGSVNINDLREAFALQKFNEHRALYGSRYVEYLRYLGVKASDARLQRPEYLGGGRQTIQFSEVVQTAQGTDPVGMLRGHGIGASRSNTFQRFFEEHGFVITILQVMPLPVYMQGIDKMFCRQVKEDYFQPELQHIGQQEIKSPEIVGNLTESSLDTVFGFQNRYDEYRSIRNLISGEFRSILDYWHMARNFSDTPVLNSDFINGPPTTRNFASTETDQFYTMINNSVVARRLLAKVGNPI